MVHTRGMISREFAQEFPIFDELINKRGSADVAQLCQQEGVASALAPGGFSAAHLCALLNLPHAIPHLASAGTPLSGALTLARWSPELDQWLERSKLDRLLRGLGLLRLGATPLSMAVALDHRDVLEALLRVGTDASPLQRCQLPHQELYYCYSCGVPPEQYLYSLTCDLSPRSQGELVALACVAGRAEEWAACVALLRSAQGRQLALGAQAAQKILELTMESLPKEGQAASDVVQLVKFLLAAGAQPNGTTCRGWPLLLLAVDRGHAAVVEAFLDAGTTVANGSRLLSAAIEDLQPHVLELVLRWYGPISVDPFALSNHEIRYWCWDNWSCPVLQLLRARVKKSYNPKAAQKAVLMAEMLTAAGYKPTVYRNVRAQLSAYPAITLVENYDPLKMRQPEEFDLAGDNKFVWLALHPEQRWTLELHYKYPPAFKAACRAVLLAVARSTKGSASRGQRSPLSSLPQELLLQVLCQAARPISAWVPSS